LLFVDNTGKAFQLSQDSSSKASRIRSINMDDVVAKALQKHQHQGLKTQAIDDIEAASSGKRKRDHDEED
jgi:hypothetical protein